MTDTTVSRLGQVNQANDAYALFLKVFGGEVLTEFERNTVFKDRHFVRTISEGKSAQFPLIGKASAAYHTPGAFIDAEAIGHAETVITIDDLLVAPTFIASIDEAMNHYDVRQPYSTELGRVLAQAYDKNVAQMATLTARSAAVLTGRPGGTVINDASMHTDGAVLEAALFSSAQTLDEKDVAETERYVFLRPAQYYLLAQREKLINKDFSGMGSIAEGRLQTVAGVDLIKTNNVPSTDVASGPAKYQGDFTDTVGIVMNKTAVGTVQLMNLAMEDEYEIRRQGTFMLGKYAVGHGMLRPECAIELSKSA